MCAEFDDDIKIYDKSKTVAHADFERLLAQIDFNASNGNQKKAETLGQLFASLKPTDAALGICAPTDAYSSPILYQARVLITFLCGRTMKNEIRDPLLIDTARGAMYQTIQANEPAYYKNLTDGAAFSFYRLAMKKEGDSAVHVGQEFAELCGSAKDASLAALGQRVYTQTVAYASAAIEKCKFQY